MSGTPTLPDLRDALLRGLRISVAPGEGVLSFERLQLLAIRFTRVARRNVHFPRGDARAQLLWDEWRTPLLKDETPGKGVAISHGQPHAHWQTTNPSGALFLDLESLWDDDEASVDHFIEACDRDETRPNRALGRWGERQWEQRLLTFVSPGEFALLPVTASASSGGYSHHYPKGLAKQQRQQIEFRSLDTDLS